MEFEAWVEAKGFALADLSDVQVAALRGAWRAEQQPAPPPKDANGNSGKGDQTATADLDDLLDKQRIERARQEHITRMVAEAASDHPARIDELEEIGKRAIKNGWTEQQTELAVLRTCRASAPLPLRSSADGGRPVRERVLECALAASCGLGDLEKQYDARTVEEAHRAFRGGMGLHQALHIAAVQNGYRGSASVKGNLKEVLHYAFLTPQANIGTSTISISGTLSNIANKFLREAFMAVDMAWREITAVRSVSDFKTITSYSLSGDLTYEEIPPGGLIKHGTLGETSYTNQAKSYGKLMGLDRRDLINDDLGALSTVSRRLGRGGALKLNSVFWTVFLNNSSFFSSGNSNVLTGTTAGSTNSALGLEGLQNADRVFRVQTDPDGNIMGVMPQILLVPTALRVTAANIMNSTITVATGVTNTSVLAPNGNAFAGLFKVVSSPYMQSSAFTGNSSTAWYLLASPADVPVIETCFLNGVEMPTIESADAEFNMLGIMLRGFWDFGVSLQEYRGGVRAAGA